MSTDAPAFPTYWLVPGALAAGPYPGSPRPGQTRKILRGLLEAGVRAFVDLTEEGEWTAQGPLAPYARELERAAAGLGVAATRAPFPVRDLDVPAAGAMVRILDHLDALRAASLPAYVHCLGGRGRTGAVLGCYLVRHAPELLGTSDAAQAGELALRRIVKARTAQGMPKAWDSPQTAVQFALVRQWWVGR